MTSKNTKTQAFLMNKGETIMKVSFMVMGKPVGKQRPRTVRNKYTGKTITYTPDATKLFESDVAKRYKKISNYVFKDGVAMSIFVYVKRPKRLTYKYPTVKPDTDNIAKTILDGLNGVAYNDDKQVIKLFIEKFYDDDDCVVVNISDYE